MTLNKMEVLNIRRRSLNRWDKDSIRPGPVGSVGDVNLQVRLKKSANYLPDRYDKTFSGANEVWSGSNVSDGQHTGFTSGGRSAVTVVEAMGYRQGFKTPVGWVHEDLRPTDRARETSMVPLGQYGRETQTASVYRAKTSGEQFLPLPGGYGADMLAREGELPRGSQIPQIVAASIGTGTALPAADVPITDPVFGDTGSIEKPGNWFNCEKPEPEKYWLADLDDPIRNDTEFIKNSAESLRAVPGSSWGWDWQWALPMAGDEKFFHRTRNEFLDGSLLSHCGMIGRPSKRPIRIGNEGPIRIPKPGNQNKRKQEEEKRKKEKKDEPKRGFMRT